MITCTVMMVSSRASHMVLASVKSVLQQDGLAEIIVVDTGNLPNLLARLQQMALSEPRLKIMPGAGKVNRATAFNIAVDKATGEYLLLLGMDCLLAPGALQGMMNGMTGISGVMLAGCNVVSADGASLESYRKKALTPEIAVAELFGVHARDMATDEQSEAPLPCEYVSNLCMCIRRQDYIAMGGLDESLAGVWDHDLCHRIRLAGARIVHLPGVCVTHLQPESGKVHYSKEQWKESKGLLRYFRKHYSGDCVPGFLFMLQLMLMIRCSWRVLTHRMHEWLLPHSIMTHSVPAKRLMVLASGLTDLQNSRDLYGRTVLVTGATSQTGLCVVKHLIARGAAVLAITRTTPIPYYHEHLRWIQGDLTDKELDLQGYIVDAVIHCAPLWTLPASIGKLVDAEVKRIIAFGSTSIFGKALSSNSFEKNFVRKLQTAEEEVARLCENSGLQWTILRPTLTYGVGLDLGITSVAKCIDRFGVFLVYPPASGRRQPVHADDLAKAAMLALDKPQTYGKSYNISGGEVLSYTQMLERIFAACEKRVRIVRTTFLPFILSVWGLCTRRKHLNGEIAHRMNDDLIFFHDDAKRDFGFEARPFLNRGLKDIEGF
ncbi:MAG: NAD-dependent epimerase/dehydratase family protein [Alphaproteobacteria bacterium]